MNIETRVEQLLDISAEIARGTTPIYLHGESYTSDAYDLLLHSLSDPIESFKLLQALCARHKDIRSEMKASYLSLLYHATYASKTTELPSLMLEIIQSNSQYRESELLATWYRVEIQLK